MRAIPEGEWISFPRTTLFIEELREIEAIFRKECDRLVLTTPGTEWESVDDLEQLNGKVVELLTFQGHDPYVRLEFRRFACEMWLSDRRETKQRGIESLVRGVLTRRATSLTPWRLMLMGAVPLALGVVGALTLPKPWGSVALMAGSVAWLALTYASYRLNRRNFSTIDPVAAASRIGFWRRNRDQLLVGGIGALVGAVVTLAGTLALGLLR